MTDIDQDADIKVYRGDDHVAVRIPLAGQVAHEWLRSFQKLARAKDLPAPAEEMPDRAWIVVRVPARFERQDVVAMMDATRALINAADAAEQSPVAEAEAVVREWWAGQRLSART
jgi:hypothetical protein